MVETRCIKLQCNVSINVKFTSTAYLQNGKKALSRFDKSDLGIR